MQQVESALKFSFLTVGRTLQEEIKRPLRITCIEGMLWLTHPELGQDVILSANESITVDANGLLVIEAMRNSRVIMGPAQSATSQSRLSGSSCAPRYLSCRGGRSRTRRLLQSLQ